MNYTNMIAGRWYKSTYVSLCIFKYEKYEEHNEYYYTVGHADGRIQYNKCINNFNYIEKFEEITDFSEVLKYFPEEQFEIFYEIY